MSPTPARAPVPSLVDQDPWLEPFRGRIAWRDEYLAATRARLAQSPSIAATLGQGPLAGDPVLDTVARAYEFYGFNRGTDAGQPGVWYREWAPEAKSLALIGDFNGWDRAAHALRRIPGDAGGTWAIFLPDAEYAERLTHGSRVKVHVVPGDAAGADRSPRDRIPAYIRRAVQEPSGDFNGQFWMPREAYVFRHPTPVRRGGLRIYEAHVGMAQEEGKIGSFADFARLVLPRIARTGYNAIQLMAVPEHPYYASFGYHVSNFFAVSSRFGTPEELKALIDAAHGLGIQVLMDLVHSHAVRNVNEGLNFFDGSDHQYFHAGGRGDHPAWDSRLFDYAKPEVLSFLLSNVRYWRDEFRFDGFRFDGVTSMLYLDHGLSRTFNGYGEYFGDNVDEDALAYLRLANLVAHASPRPITTIAEDVSGMPGTARPVSEGGLGFDYRLAMGVPDAWIKFVKERPDEEWSLGEIYSTLLNRRRGEKHVAYAESHDQALVGDQTLSFRLMDKEMYEHMGRDSASPIIDRGIALHKLIRLITFSLAGEAWLSFMGNEFGHPEWVDFPRAGNGNSFQYARRQWSLADRADLRYAGLLEFDRALQKLDSYYGVLQSAGIRQLLLREDEKLLVYARGALVFAFNFHPSASYPDLRIPVPESRDYRVILDTDEGPFGGPGRVATAASYPWQPVPSHGQAQSVQLYLPSRSAQVLIGI